MTVFMEGRFSDSSYIQGIWHGHTEGVYTPICPAAAEWDLLLQRKNGTVRVFFEGPLTRAKSKLETDDTEFCVIRFKAGTFLPVVPIRKFLDVTAPLPGAARNHFWLHGTTWEFPRHEDAECFVARLVREEALLRDPVVSAALQDHPLDLSFRTVRRRFLNATGLTQGVIRQIERAQHAAELLSRGVTILDVVDAAGYADQPHLTRSIKRFMGQTPAHIARTQLPQPATDLQDNAELRTA
jgi:AraC-like DNA-binding protein